MRTTMTTTRRTISRPKSRSCRHAMPGASGTWSWSWRAQGGRSRPWKPAPTSAPPAGRGSRSWSWSWPRRSRPRPSSAGSTRRPSRSCRSSWPRPRTPSASCRPASPTSSPSCPGRTAWPPSMRSGVWKLKHGLPGLTWSFKTPTLPGTTTPSGTRPCRLSWRSWSKSSRTPRPPAAGRHRRMRPGCSPRERSRRSSAATSTPWPATPCPRARRPRTRSRSWRRGWCARSRPGRRLRNCWKTCVATAPGWRRE
mmetsp:Transcript_588/g.1507  ORF Transcript_588/g.1507 Transcript_588/m.1507 type:complete len:253 (+) Transcript_588:136-894(+)